ncbi:MAG: DUF1127 domain-containing protein [Amaricoccus sp.]
MTNAYASIHGQSRASALEAGVDAVKDRIRTAWKQFRAYRRTLAELRDLSPRMLRDLDFDRANLSAIARREVYGR